MTTNQANRLRKLSALQRRRIISKGEHARLMHELNKQIWVGK